MNLITLYARTGNLPRAEQHYQPPCPPRLQLAEAHHAFGLALLLQATPRGRGHRALEAVDGLNPHDAAGAERGSA